MTTKRAADKSGQEDKAEKLSPVHPDETKEPTGKTERPADQTKNKLDDVDDDNVNPDDTESKKLKNKGDEEGPEGITEAKKAKHEQEDDENGGDDEEKKKPSDDDEEGGDDNDNGDDEEKNEKKSSKKMKNEEEIVEDLFNAIQESCNFEIDDQLGSLLESEDLSEEFQSKAKTIFEAAVNDVAKSHLKQINETVLEKFKEQVNEYKEEIDEQVDKYLDYVVNEWAEENKLAIDEGIRNENAESFMTKLADLLDEHFVEVPDDKKDAYKVALKEKEDTEETLNNTIESNIELKEELSEAKKALEVEKFTKSMTDTQAEKIRSLAEGVDFEDEDSFQAKLETLKENWFPEKETGDRNDDAITEDVSGDAVNEEEDSLNNPEMRQYVDTISRHFGRD